MRKMLSMEIFKPDGSRDVEFIISEFMNDYDHVFYFQEFRFDKGNNTDFKWADEFYTMTEAEEHFNKVKSQYEDNGHTVKVKDWYKQQILSWT